MKLLLFQTNVECLNDQKKVRAEFSKEKKIIKSEFQPFEEHILLFVYGSNKLSTCEIQEMVTPLGFTCNYYIHYCTNETIHDLQTQP